MHLIFPIFKGGGGETWVPCPVAHTYYNREPEA